VRYAIVLTILPERTRRSKPRACILERAGIYPAENDARTARSSALPHPQQVFVWRRRADPGRVVWL